jgi:hypothetical protein
VASFARVRRTFEVVTGEFVFEGEVGGSRGMPAPQSVDMRGSVACLEGKGASGWCTHFEES